MRTASPPYYMKKGVEEQTLSRKWGFKDPNANDCLERTRHMLIHLLINPIAWKTFNISQANYFLAVLEFEARWKQGEFRSWKDFWAAQSDEIDSENEKKIDNQAFYVKAQSYLSALINPAEADIFSPTKEEVVQ